MDQQEIIEDARRITTSIETARHLWLIGKSQPEISAQTGLPEEMLTELFDPVAMSAVKLSQSERRERQTAVVRMYKEGLTVNQLANRFGLAASSIHKILKDRGVKCPTEHVTSSTLLIIADLIRSKSDAATAAAHKVTRQHVSAVRQRATEAGIFQAAQELANRKRPKTWKL